MIIDLKNFFSQAEQKREIEYDFSMADVEIEGFKPFVSPIKVCCEVSAKSGSVLLTANVNFDYSMPCDRCLEETLTHRHLNITHLLTKEDCEDSDDYYVTVGDELDLDNFFYEEILLNLPVKYVCSDDCRGLCPRCGTNLNIKNCDCKKSNVDPRLEALQALLTD